MTHEYTHVAILAQGVHPKLRAIRFFFPIRAGGFNFSILEQKPPWVRIGSPMFRPHQSLELDEIVKKLNRTWGCKLDLTHFAPPGPRQTSGWTPPHV